MRSLVVRFSVGLLFAGLSLVSPVWGGELGAGTLLAWDHWDQRHVPLNPARPESVKPVVLIVPGMMNGDDSMSIFKQRFSDEQIPAAIFRYDCALGVERVAAKLEELLATEAKLYPNRKMVLLTHSMGGVVCRRVVEDPNFKLNSISHLIMVAPPNAGSTVATLQGDRIKELAQGVQDERLARILGEHFPAVIKEALGLYAGQARIDMSPDSDLMKKVNGFGRNPRIQYTVIAGTKAPLRPAIFGLSGLLLQNLGAGEGQLGEHVRGLMEAANRDEWIDKKGDGAVTVASTRLPNVSDHVELRFAHCDTCRDPQMECNLQLIECVMQRLPIK